jgi:hypothetical protein
MFINQPTLFLAAALASAALAGSAGAASGTVNQFDATKAFRADHPKAMVMTTAGRLHKIADPAIATGHTAKDSAVAAKATVAAMLGVDPDAFIEVGPFPNGQHELGLMPLPGTDAFKFTAYYWTQTAGGLPVWRSRLMALVRNDHSFPTVQITSDVRDVKGFVAPQRAMVDSSLAFAAAANLMGRDVKITKPELVVFAGIDDMVFAPRAAMVFESTLGDTWNPDVYEKRLLVVDLLNGQVLHEENRILHGISGTVEGMNTQSSGADECDVEVAIPLAYAKVTAGGLSTNTDSKGFFELNTTGNVTIGSAIEGLYFNVNESSGDDSASQAAADGDYVTITHHEANNNEQYRAQVNAYVESNEVRDYILTYSPSFPVLSGQLGFPVNTGVSGSCNAFYDYSSINFYNAGGGCNNTAFSVIVHHEYGHHAVASAGSGQDSYGEGMGDVLGVLLTGDNQLARGFYQGDCVNGIRNADNSKQYPCSGGIHDCGQLISGCVWDAMELVEAAFPGEAYDIVSYLAINSMPLHSGGGIDPTITLDWLTLDDDDGDLSNGTPHSVPILAAFALHNMDQIPEPLDNDDCSTAREITWGTWDVNTIGALASGVPVDESQCTNTYMTDCDPDVWYHLVACGTGTMTVSLCDTVSFDSDLAVYAGTCGGLEQVACNGDGAGCGGYTSYLDVSVVEGQSYFVRVGGYQGATGSGFLIVDGPGDPCDAEPVLTIGYPDGRPDFIDPNGSTMVAVQIDNGTGSPLPGSENLVYRVDGGTWMATPLDGTGGGAYVGVFPAVPCAADIDWFIEVTVTDIGEVTSPSGAPSTSWNAAAYSDVIVAFEDDFQSDQGWSVDAGAGTGNWMRVTPGNGGARCDNPTDADGSGMCYVTGNATDEDVDDGTTILTSPSLDASEGGLLSYARWYSNGSDCGGGDAQNDIFEVEFSVDAGGSWANLETVGPTGGEVSGGWFEVAFDLGDVAGFTPTNEFRLRFICGDLNTGSVIEAAVDAISLTKPDCGDPACAGDLDGSGDVGANDLLQLIGAWGTPDGDANGDGLTNADDILLLIGNWGPCV